SHGGVDWSALARATWLDVQGGGIKFGGSTITMQLVRLLAGTPRKSFTGKLRQMVLAGRLERTLSKHDILKHYLNRGYYGHGAWGAKQAAQIYFGKRAIDLSVGKAAFLAVLPRGPSTYDPFRHKARAQASPAKAIKSSRATASRAMTRRSHILALM